MKEMRSQEKSSAALMMAPRSVSKLLGWEEWYAWENQSNFNLEGHVPNVTGFLENPSQINIENQNQSFYINPKFFGRMIDHTDPIGIVTGFLGNQSQSVL